MKTEDKLYNYLKKVSLPKIKVGAHKEYLKQKLEAEFKTYKPVYLYNLLKYSLTIASIFIVIFLGYFSFTIFNDVLKKQEVVQNCIVTYIKGKAYLINPDNTERDLVLGENLIETQNIKTAGNSIVELQIGNSSVVRIKENSILKIAKLYKDKELESTRFNLDVGRILAKPKDLTEGSSFEIETSSIAAGVRGTEFIVINENGIIKVAVNKGVIYIKINIDIDDIDKIKALDKKLSDLLYQSVNTEFNISENEKLVVDSNIIKNFEIKVNNEISKISEELEVSKDSKETINNILNKIRTEIIARLKDESESLIKKEPVSDKEWEELFDKEEFNEIKVMDIEKLEKIEKKSESLKEFEKINMIKVRQGRYQMGSNNEDDEQPVHLVNVKAFEISPYEITFNQYDYFCEITGREKPSDNDWGRDNRPVINVSWYDAIEFCNWLSEKEGLMPCYTIDKTKKDENNKALDKYDTKKWIVACDFNANGYRLPTETEWEYAARGNTAKTSTDYSGSNNIDDVAWYYNNSGNKSQIIGIKKPNQFKIYDMSGNAWEWCWDWYDSKYSEEKRIINPQEPESGISRVLRGGSFKSDKSNVRVTNRNYSHSPDSIGDFGFRIVKNGM